MWIAFDLLIGTGFACGGWALAWAVYVFNRGQYHPLVRPALLASLFGYSLGGLSITIDVGRYWNLPYFYIPGHFNVNSVLFETAGCVEVCPAGAVIFGTREELMAEAKKRLELKPGSEYHYPRQTLKSGDTYLHTVPKYYPHLYGEKEGGGTQVLVLTGVPYENLDLPKLDDLSTGARSENIQHTLYKGMMLPLAVLAGLTVLVRRNSKNDHHDGGDDHES